MLANIKMRWCRHFSLRKPRGHLDSLEQAPYLSRSRAIPQYAYLIRVILSMLMLFFSRLCTHPNMRYNNIQIWQRNNNKQHEAAF